eukprot:3236338-Pleurochrysis_carterae.AAC.2
MSRAGLGSQAARATYPKLRALLTASCVRYLQPVEAFPHDTNQPKTNPVRSHLKMRAPHVHAHARARTHARACTRTHARARTHAHAHPRTRTRTHA